MTNPEKLKIKYLWNSITSKTNFIIMTGPVKQGIVTAHKIWLDFLNFNLNDF